MATKYVTLKDSNGDTLYPQAVATNLVAGSIGTDLLADGAVTTDKLGAGAVTPAKLSKGYLYLPYYGTSIVTINSNTYSALATGTINMHGGALLISGHVYGVKTNGGTVGLLVQVDNNTPIRVSMHNLEGNSPLVCNYILTGLSAGSHTISYGVAIQSGSGNSYAVNAYCEDSLTFVEL